MSCIKTAEARQGLEPANSDLGAIIEGTEENFNDSINDATGYPEIEGTDSSSGMSNKSKEAWDKAHARGRSEEPEFTKGSASMPVKPKSSYNENGRQGGPYYIDDLDYRYASKEELSMLKQEMYGTYNSFLKILSNMHPSTSGQAIIPPLKNVSVTTNEAGGTKISDEWITVQEAEKILKRNRRTIRNYARKGLIKQSKMGGSVYYYKPSIIKYLMENMS